MKDLKIITILTVFFIALSATSPLAQGKQTKTSSAKAAYGYQTEFKSNSKKKKKKQN